MRWLAIALTMIVVGAGCSGGAAARPVAGREPTAAVAPRRLAVSWSAPLGGVPGGVATDGAGSVVSVDNDAVVALDERGAPQWSSRVPGAGLGWPALGAGLVVVPTLRDAGGPGGCVALDRTSGARRWTYEEPASAGVAVARAGRLVVCALGNGVIVALDRATGKRRWRTVFAPGVTRAAVSISERTALAVDEATGTLAFGVRVGSSWFVATLDVETGADRGLFDFSRVGPVSAPADVARGELAVGVSGSREVCVLDLRRGRVGPCAAVPVPEGFDPASIPVLADGLLVIAARDGSVSAIDLAAMKVRWSVRVPAPILGARPDAVGGVVMFDDWTRSPWAVRLADGSAVALPAFDGWVVSTVADADGGFEVAKRDTHDGWIERWAPVA